MATPVSICSQALLLLGDKPISAFNDVTDRARLASNLYPDARLALLRLHPWNCATRRIILAPESDTPAFGDWSHQFALPGDCIRVWGVGRYKDRPEPYMLEGRRILYSGTACYLRYSIDTPEDQWDALLVDLMIARMAAAFAYPITKSGAEAERRASVYGDALEQAQLVDGQENPPEAFDDSTLLDARY